MRFPTVTEIPPRLEPVTPDTFIAAPGRLLGPARERQQRVDDRTVAS